MMKKRIIQVIIILGLIIWLVLMALSAEAEAYTPIAPAPDVEITVFPQYTATVTQGIDFEEVTEVKLNDIPLTRDEQLTIRSICDYEKIDYRFVYALMQTESNFKWATGDGNLNHKAIGYFQISTINAERMKESYGLDIYDRLDNLEAGMRIIKELMDKFPDGYAGYDQETAVIMCYKCGISRGTELMDEGFVLEAVQVIKDTKADFNL